MKRILILLSVSIAAICNGAGFSFSDTVFLGNVQSAPAASWTPTTPSNTLLEALRSEDITGNDSDAFAPWVASAGKNATNAFINPPHTKTDGPNGRRYVHFNNDNFEALQTAGWDGGVQAQPLTIAGAFRRWDAAGGAVFGGNNTANRVRLYQNGSQFALATGNGGGMTSVDVLATDGNWHSFVFIVNGASTVVAFDGGTFSSAIDVGTVGLEGLTLNNNFDMFTGGYYDIGEWYCWSGALGTTDRDSANAYLNARWH